MRFESHRRLAVIDAENGHADGKIVVTRNWAPGSFERQVMSKIDWVEIPAGEFSVGLDPSQQWQVQKRLGRAYHGLLDATMATYDIAHRIVPINTFYIARYPVTHAQMDEFLERYSHLLDERVQPSPPEPPHYPEESSWNLANLFSQEIGGRLPTALEWEKAARGIDGRIYPWGNEWDASRGNFTGDKGQPGYPTRAKGFIWTAKTPVDGYPSGASPYGVLDMVGNVSEWTATAKSTARTHQNGFVLKGQSVKDVSPPVWFWHIVALETVYPIDAAPVYIGFRPVRDHWERESWQGFRV